MSAGIKARLRDWAPPRLLEYLRESSSSGIRFDGPYKTWAAARQASGGYDDASILQRVRDATLKVKRGDAAYERDSVIFSAVEYSWPLLAALLWAAAQERGRTSVLDFGGSLGSSYFQNRVFLDALSDVSWGVVEQPHYVACGAEYIADERLRFFASIRDCAARIRPNLILFSSVLQYLPEYEPILNEALGVGASTIVVDRTMIGLPEGDGIYIQRVPASIYQASYPCRILDENRLRGQIESRGYELVSDFDSLPFAALRRISAHYKGYVFQMSASA